jgi:hypothetical protein
MPPDQVELKVAVVTDGTENITRLVQSMDNLARAVSGAETPLKRAESSIHQVGGAKSDPSRRYAAALASDERRDA